MKAVIQRVLKAGVRIGDLPFSQTGPGLLIFIGIEVGDLPADASGIAAKICQMRIFSDEHGKMNLSLIDTGGDALIISQFTLIADTRRGNRPSFILAAKPPEAIPLYELFIAEVEKGIAKKVSTGQFGADMQVSLVNDGPVTIHISSPAKG